MQYAYSKMCKLLTAHLSVFQLLNSLLDLTAIHVWEQNVNEHHALQCLARNVKYLDIQNSKTRTLLLDLSRHTKNLKSYLLCKKTLTWVQFFVHMLCTFHCKEIMFVLKLIITRSFGVISGMLYKCKIAEIATCLQQAYSISK